jgi:hypothetical protein
VPLIIVSKRVPNLARALRARACGIGKPLYTCHVPWSACSTSDAEVGVPLCAASFRLCKYVGFISTCV